MDALTYAEVGATAGEMPAGYHHVRARRVIGRGREVFERAADALLAGEAQRRAGARVELSETPMREGTRVTMRLGVGILSFRIPCLVVWAERTETVAGFAYGTLPGHPERARRGSRSPWSRRARSRSTSPRSPAPAGGSRVSALHSGAACRRG